MKHLESNDILADVQYMDSDPVKLSYIFLTIDDFARALDYKFQVYVAILDFVKAFDKVACARLTHKLHYYGITGHILQWIQSFLANRTQKVAIDSRQSSPCSVTSGIPQGSVTTWSSSISNKYKENL